jgi:hypothetical protein
MQPINRKHSAALGTPLANLLGRLDTPRLTSSGWSARCPAHDDRSPSLSLSEGRDGRVLVRCWAGCEVEDIVHAVGLEVRDLFAADDKRRPFTPRPQRSRVAVPQSVAQIFIETGEFALCWDIAKQIAELDPHIQRAYVVRHWDEIAPVDVTSVLELAYLLRGVAVFRFLTSKTVQDPMLIRNAVRRLLREVEAA